MKWHKTLHTVFTSFKVKVTFKVKLSPLLKSMLECNSFPQAEHIEKSVINIVIFYSILPLKTRINRERVTEVTGVERCEVRGQSWPVLWMAWVQSSCAMSWVQVPLSCTLEAWRVRQSLVRDACLTHTSNLRPSSPTLWVRPISPVWPDTGGTQ